MGNVELAVGRRAALLLKCGRTQIKNSSIGLSSPIRGKCIDTLKRIVPDSTFVEGRERTMYHKVLAGNYRGCPGLKLIALQVVSYFVSLPGAQILAYKKTRSMFQNSQKLTIIVLIIF